MRKNTNHVVTQQMKDYLMDVQVMLNGKRAFIRGRLNPYATVCTQDHTLSGQWSWNAVQRIVAHSGEFTL